VPQRGFRLTRLLNDCDGDGLGKNDVAIDIDEFKVQHVGAIGDARLCPVAVAIGVPRIKVDQIKRENRARTWCCVEERLVQAVNVEIRELQLRKAIARSHDVSNIEGRYDAGKIVGLTRARYEPSTGMRHPRCRR
jgi:hypothetical protein